MEAAGVGLCIGVLKQACCVVCMHLEPVESLPTGVHDCVCFCLYLTVFLQGVLLCGLTSTQVQAVVVGPAHAGGHHLSSVLKFVALRDAVRPSDVMPLGGAWSKDIDGGDPAR
jgi:hypothetical protein